MPGDDGHQQVLAVFAGHEDRALRAVVKALADPDPALREAASQAAAKLIQVAKPRVAHRLIAPALRDRSTPRRVALLTVLAGWRHPHVLPAVEEALADSDPSMRLAAARGLGLWPPMTKVKEILVWALGDRDPRVRAAAADSLGGMGPEAIPYLESLLRRPPDRQARGPAIRGVLAEIRKRMAN